MKLLVWLVVVLAFAAVALAGPGIGTFMVKGYLTGGYMGIQHIDQKIAVPDEYNILDVSGATNRLLVSVQKFFESDGPQPKYRSEVWQFSVYRGEDGARGFDDRLVLFSIDSVGGIRNQVCRYTVNCPRGTAVYLEGYERGTTIVFDEDGNKMEVDWRACKKPNSRSGFGFIRPLTWLLEQNEPEDERKYRLVCVATNLGVADTHILLFDPQAETVEVLPLASAFSDFGESILLGIIQQH